MDEGRCLIDWRFANDAESRELAQQLFANARAVPTVVEQTEIAALDGEVVKLVPALPVGDRDRHHLAWLLRSLEQHATFIETVTTSLTASSASAGGVRFESKPAAVAFYRTVAPRTYPSAFVVDDVIAYNLNGQLQTNWREMHETLFHELFHMNDGLHGEMSEKTWSEVHLKPIFDRMVAQCGESRSCYEPFAPYLIAAGGDANHDHDRHSGGHDSDRSVGESSVTASSSSSSAEHHDAMYAFAPKAREVRELAAEVGLRYFLEHERIFMNARRLPPYKCRTELNGRAWQLVVDEFFGGLDLTAPCGRETTSEE